MNTNESRKLTLTVTSFSNTAGAHSGQNEKQFEHHFQSFQISCQFELASSSSSVVG